MRDAPAVLMLHGFTGSGASWQPVIARLGERYRAIAPDIRGHASASDVRPVDLDGVLDDIERSLAAAELACEQRFVLVGYSQGGRIALHAALDPRFRERISKLVLIGSSPGLATAQEREARRAADEHLAAEFERLTIEAIAARWAQTPILGGITEAQAQQANADRLRSTPAGLAAALRGLGTGALPSLWERLPQITAPVSLIAGERDGKFRAVCVQMADHLNDATIHTVPGTGHAVQLEDPQVVAALIAGGR
jgi:2-succinyl-6-hydroxy-2,4-cyclohexadiene-1-carboxylate synthase